MSNTVGTTLTAGEHAQVIDDGKSVGEKFNNTLFSLEIIKSIGHPSYGEMPQKRLGDMKKEDAMFNTDINKELQRIELLLKQQKLEQQWRKEGRGQELHPDEEEDAMLEWINEQIQQGAASEVKLRLPTQKRADLKAMSLLDNKNTDYEATVCHRKSSAQKGPGDRVAYGGKHGLVIMKKEDMCQIRWDKPEENEDEVSEIPTTDLVLVSKAHPGMLITAEMRRPNYERAAWKHQTNQVSQYATLFSQCDGSSPDFLQPSTTSRKAKIEKMLQMRKGKMMTSKSGHTTSAPARRKKEHAVPKSKFMQKPPFAPLGTKEVQIAKEPSEPLGLVFDPETMCLTEIKDGTPSAALDECRGMRVTHVSTRTEYSPFSNEEGVHSKEQLRKALAKATRSDTVAFRFETWTQRRAVEKKKRENREKLIATKDKAIKDRSQA
eukprot:TRINITY_DN11250_c0_g2_i1.p1 TRINITY_DN11250_c0_g2~~TRINITY_DN11250_c0_g2_i1.p1  ORF type:complete len:448 (+),score=141.09 TRINITY_DN11250_c0_g2_i1:41-1345(+)